MDASIPPSSLGQNPKEEERDWNNVRTEERGDGRSGETRAYLSHDELTASIISLVREVEVRAKFCPARTPAKNQSSKMVLRHLEPPKRKQTEELQSKRTGLTRVLRLGGAAKKTTLGLHRVTHSAGNTSGN